MTNTFEDFAAINRQRCESSQGFNHPLSSWSTSDWFTAVLGELGEAANMAKKLNRVRDGIPGNKETSDALILKLRNELGDTFVYLDLLCQSLGFTIGVAARDVFNTKSDELGCPIRFDPTVDAGRLEQQARDISVLLSDAGVNAMPIPEGVRTVIVERDRYKHAMERACDESVEAGKAQDVAEARCTALADAAEMLWVVLANVSGGDWKQQTPEWQEAAARWRDNYFAALKVGSDG